MVQATDFRENSFKAIQEIKAAILRVVSISSNLFLVDVSLYIMFVQSKPIQNWDLF